MFIGVDTAVLVTMSSLAILVVGFLSLYRICKPFNFFKAVMFIVCVSICISLVILFYDVFKYVEISYTEVLFLIIVCQAAYPLSIGLNRLFDLSKNVGDISNSDE